MSRKKINPHKATSATTKKAMDFRHNVLLCSLLSKESPHAVCSVPVVMQMICFYLRYDKPDVKANLESVETVRIFQLLQEKTVRNVSSVFLIFNIAG